MCKRIRSQRQIPAEAHCRISQNSCAKSGNSGLLRTTTSVKIDGLHLTGT